MARYYYLGPWQETIELGQDAVFQDRVLPGSDITVQSPPEGTVGLVDLRPASGTGGYGFFATDRPLGSDYEPFGDGINRLEDVTLTAQQPSKWASMLDMPGVAGTTLLDVLWETLTVQADPDGQVRALPIMPTHRGMLELHLAGHSLLRSERLTSDHPAFQVICQALQEHYDRIGGDDPNLAAKWLGAQQRKLGLTAAQAVDLLIPSGSIRRMPLRPTTAIQDDFDRDNDFSGLDASAEGWAWSEQTGFGLYDQCATLLTYPRLARAEMDLSSQDHYVQARIAAMPSIGVLARATTDNIYSGSPSYYSYVAGNTASRPTRLYKTVESGMVAIDGGSDNGGLAADAGQTLRLVCDGSTLTGYVDGRQSLRITDTGITGNLRCGLRGSVSLAQLDDFVAADLIAPVTKHPVGGDFF